jgi:predicted  nucleic acid-binding Zn-ribbon protein
MMSIFGLRNQTVVSRGKCARSKEVLQEAAALRGRVSEVQGQVAEREAAAEKLRREVQEARESADAALKAKGKEVARAERAREEVAEVLQQREKLNEALQVIRLH